MGGGDRLMTADELIRLPRGRERHELVLGVLRTMPLRTMPESIASTAIGASLYQYVRDRRLGKTLANAGFTLTVDPDTVRGPAVSFISAERVRATPLGPGYWPGAPDLAVEVISPSDLYVDVADRVADLLEHGTRLVIVVNPWLPAVAVHRPDRTVLTLTENDDLDGGDVVPGWSLPVRELFREF